MNDNAPKNNQEEEVDMSYVDMAAGTPSTPSVMDNVRTAQAEGDPSKVAEVQKAADEKYSLTKSTPEDVSPLKGQEVKTNEERASEVVFFLNQKSDHLKREIEILQARHAEGKSVNGPYGGWSITAQSVVNIPEDIDFSNVPNFESSKKSLEYLENRYADLMSEDKSKGLTYMGRPM